MGGRIATWRSIRWLAALPAAALPLLAQDSGPTDGWRDSAEFSWVATAGNTETSTLGLKNKTWRRWERQAVEFDVSAVRAEAADQPFAVQSAGPPGFVIVEPSPELSAEAYLVGGKYYRQIHERFFWQAGAGWDRDRFAGIEDRYVVFGGVGNNWVDREKMHWRTDYSASVTDQQDVVEDPATPGTFGGMRATSSFDLGFGKSSRYGNDTILDLNLRETEDWRVAMTNWVSVTMTEHLALKVNLQWLYDNLPQLEELALFDFQPGGVQVGSVTQPLEDLDTIFTASLVVGF
jgi:putative salt-induced outer membrane protein YdiY